MANFYSCNSKLIGVDMDVFEMTDEMKGEYLQKSIESGLIVDQENDVYIREGYGALVAFSVPDNCRDISDVLNYTLDDFHRKTVGKPSIMEKIKLKVLRETLYTNPYFGYVGKLLNEGYDLVLGPGCSVNGFYSNKSIYCKNYLEILEREKDSKLKTR